MAARSSTRRGPVWPVSMALAAIILATLPDAVHAQTGTGAQGTVPPAASPSTPAEVQPGHPPPPGGSAPTGPQSALPTPQPPGNGADTPNGSARNGVIAPPGTPGGNPQVNPK